MVEWMIIIFPETCTRIVCTNSAISVLLKCFTLFSFQQVWRKESWKPTNSPVQRSCSTVGTGRHCRVIKSAEKIRDMQQRHEGLHPPFPHSGDCTEPETPGSDPPISPRTNVQFLFLHKLCVLNPFSFDLLRTVVCPCNLRTSASLVILWIEFHSTCIPESCFNVIPVYLTPSAGYEGLLDDVIARHCTFQLCLSASILECNTTHKRQH